MLYAFAFAPFDPQKHHYVYVKNLSRLIAHRSKYKCRSHVCLNCVQVFSSERVLEKHHRCCLVHSPQQIVFPEPEKCRLTFDSHRCEHPFDFYYVADFESILKPHDDDNDPTLVNTHETAWILFTQNDAKRKLSDTAHHIFWIERHRKISRTHFFPNRKKLTRSCPFNVP